MKVPSPSALTFIRIIFDNFSNSICFFLILIKSYLYQTIFQRVTFAFLKLLTLDLLI